VTRRLGALGAFAVAPDIYFRSATLPKSRTGATDAARQQQPDRELVSDLDATLLGGLQGGDTNRSGSSAFAGRRTVWLYAAHNASLKAGVAFYGSLMDPPSAAMPKNAFDLATR